MMEGGSSGKKKGAAQSQNHAFAQLIFSWSLEDIVNENLYEHQVEKIPLTFQSEEQYFRSFVYPLLEETRTELASSMEMMYRAPFSEISSFSKAKGKEKMMYDVTVGNWRNSENRKEGYRTLPGNLLILANGEPGSVSDLQSSTWAFLLVNNTTDDDSGQFKVTASQKIEFHDGMFVVFLMNITTQKRIWNSLHKHANLDIIKEILYPDSVVKEKCDMCSLGSNTCVQRFVSKLNESQKTAITAAIRKTECCHKSSVEQIWGPPGTGKTMAVSVMLSIFLQMKCRTLTCAPTNVAIVTVASRVLSLVKESSKTVTASGDSFCSIGDVLLFGNKDRLKVGTTVEEIYLEHRVDRLTECLGSLTGWKHCIKSMIDLLEECASQYHVFLENQSFKEKQLTDEKKSRTKNLKVKSFMEFVRERFNSCALPLRKCIVTFCTHIPTSFMKQENFQTMVTLLDNLSSLESFLSQKNLVSEELEKILVSKPLEDDFVKSGLINSARIMSLSLLKTLQTSLGGLKLPSVNKDAITRFCYERASLIFCTTSTSYKLQKVKMEPLKLLVIDEAAQMKESEAIIPLQIPGMKHAILIGDECQLPATVKSNVSSECGLGRSLFERLSLLGHSKHLLNVQYRMHPKISSFPNCKFYQNQILDAKDVTCKSYVRQYLPGPMFGSYSFINIVGGREEGDDVGSKRNMVEVSIVIKIVQKVYKAWQQAKKKVSIGVVSPYASQVVSIEEKLRYKYEKLDGFSVTVKSIDGFQGGEEDIIILSTVRSNSHGSVGFTSSPQRTNVALTRARHCLWILGNERTLARSDSVWKDLVRDARNRGCLFDADADKCLKKIIIDAKKELEPLNDMVKGNSLLLKHVKWKVLFSDSFRKSFGKLMDSRMKNLVVDLLQKLSRGWRPNDGNTDLKVLKTYKVEGLHVICTTDIIKEFKYIQVLKVWDVLPLKEIPNFRKELDSIFAAYTDDYMNRCTTKCLEGNLEIPQSWATSKVIIQFRNAIKCEVGMNPGDNNSEVSESLLHMKFYSLSPGMVDHLRFGRGIDLPMQLSDEQMDIFLYSKSSFIIGQSGTDKTTILTTKLLQNEQSFRKASEAESRRVRDDEVADDHKENKPTVLRQLFVTVNPKLCNVVKQHVSHLTSVSCDGNSSAEINFDDVSESDVPDTFVDVPEKSYPLVITFFKFLMMLDGTLGNSFFERFLETREGSLGNHISSRSVALHTFIRSRNVTFDRFCSLYWPHFDSNLTKKLDPSRVFTEIISHIKGGLQAGENCDGKLSYEGYSLLSEGRASTLTKQKRETVNTLFVSYQKMKSERGEFDLGDLVTDLHRRLKNMNYEGDQMDCIYIDEVQDLSMRQISLFKYICQNVDKGFIFAGNTALNIAKGVDFRFEDIRLMFYREFLGTRSTGQQEKANVPEIFQLKQNSRSHVGVIKLAQSVIDILYCYFAHSIDILEPETSFISGEAPVLLKSGNDQNGIVTIFGGTGTSEGTVSFGAEQVILVRDEHAKIEICQYVGKQALVLTISECKGLEFQDALLYNFFESSPLKDQWSVIYGYMKEHDWLDEKLSHSFPSFKESKHNVLCSELKQLYVAITRTSKRLWIYEDKEELSKPMFDYWKKRGLVQVRKLNDSFARATRRVSSAQEWLERGKKLFYENIFVMATMCFERAGDLMWETMAKAFGLRISADQMNGTNPEAASCYLREAAELFESIGKLEESATCYCDLGDHERAGKFYLDKCGQIDAAAECFILAGYYSEAAEVYAKGDQFSNCLSVCRKGELFFKGLQYIQHRKEHVHDRSKEIEHIEQEFLESCALSYYERKDPKSMMIFVRAFCSMESKRIFLRSLGCLDDLMLLEEESGRFLDAAELASSSGDVLKEAGYLKKAGCCEEATFLILWYVSSNSLWGNGNTGWPLKQFAQKNELCKKAKSFAKEHSYKFHAMVCSEITALSHKQVCLSKLKKQLHTSRQHESLRREFILIRKILDAHFQLDILTYDWEDDLPIDTNKYVEDKVSQDRVSVRTLVFYFNLWKDHVMDIFQTLEDLDNGEPNKNEGHVDFSLNYLGVRKQCVHGNIIYSLVNKDMNWVRNAGDHRGLHRYVDSDGKQLVHSMRSYWRSELVSVGLNILETIQLLYNSTSKGSAFRQSTSLLHIFEVSKFLLDCQYLDLTFHHTNSLQDFYESSMTYFDFVFPLDWRGSVSSNLVSLRETDLSLNFLEEVILQLLKIELDFTCSTIGRVMMICLSSKKSIAVYKKIIRALEWNPLWKSFVEKFWEDGFDDVYVAPALKNALEDTYRVYGWLPGYMSPHSFLYLVDRLLFMASFSSGVFFTTKSSFLEWYTSTLDTTSSTSKQIFSKDITDFILGIVQDILYKKEETISWIERSNIVASYYHPLIALKLLMIVSLVSLQLLDCSHVLVDLLVGWNNIAYLLPQKFVSDLLRVRNSSNLNLNPDMVAEAFASVEDPLLIVNSENATPRIHAPCAIFVDLKGPREEIMSVLLPSNATHSAQKYIAANNSWDHLTTLHEVKNSWDDHTTLRETKNSWVDLKQHSFASDMSRLDVVLSVSTSDKMVETDDEHSNDYHSPLNLVLEKESNNDLQQSSYASDTSRPEVNFVVSRSDDTTMQTFFERGQSSRPMVDGFLNQSITDQEWKVKQKVGLDCSNVTETLHEENQVEETGDEHGNGDHLAVDLEVEKERSNDNTINTKNTTLQEANNSWDDLKQPSFASDISGKMEETGNEHTNDYHSPSNLVLEKESNNENTQDAEIKKGKGKNKRNMTKKNKCSLNTLTAVLVDGQQCVGGETSLSEASNACNDLKQPSYASDTSRPEVELSVSKSDQTTVVDGLLNQSVMDLEWKVIQTVGSESNNTSEVLQDFKDENDVEQTGDHSHVELVLEKESSKENHQDVEIKKGRQRTRWKRSKKGKGSIHTVNTVVVDGQQYAGEDSSTLPKANTVWNNDLQESSYASDTRQPGVDFVVCRSDDTTTQTFVERGQISRPMVAGFLNHFEETGDEHSNGDHSLVELEVESQSGNNNTQDSGSKTQNTGSSTQNTLPDKQPCASEGTAPHVHEASNSWDDLKQPSFASDISRRKVELSVSTSGKKTTGERLKSSKRDGFSSRSVMGRVAESSNTTEALPVPEEKYDDEHIHNTINVGHSLRELVLEKQTTNESTQDAEIKNGNGKNKGRWIKKNNVSNSVNTFAGDEHRNVHSPVELVLEKQTRNENTKGVEIKKGKGKNMDKWIKKNKGGDNLNAFTGDNDHLVVEVQASNGNIEDVEIKKGNGKNTCSSRVNTSTADEDRPVELVLESQTTNENTKDVKINKGKVKNVEKWIKKSKCSSSVNTCTSYEDNNDDHSLVELVLEKENSNGNAQDMEIKKGKGKNIEKGNKKSKGSNSPNTFTSDGQSNENTQDVQIKKGKGKNMEKWFKKNKGSNSLDIFTSDEHNNNNADHSTVEFVVEKQSSNEKTSDVKIKKGKGKSKKNKGSNNLNTFTTVLVDGQHRAREDTTLRETNTAFNDPKQPSSTYDMSRPEDGFLNYVGLESSSSITKALQEVNNVEEIVDDHNTGDHSPHELVLEIQSNNHNTQDVENNKRKGKYVAGEVTIVCEANSACNDMNPPSSAFDTRIKTLDVVKSVACWVWPWHSWESASGGKLD